MKKYRVFSVICLAVLVIGLVWAYINVPDTLILYRNRQWKTNSVSRLVNLDESIEVSQGAIVPRLAGDYSASLSIFGIPYKSVTVTVLEDDKVIPGGQTVGIRLYSDGLVVIALGRVNSTGQSPAEDAGIEVGDVITKINGEKVGSPEEFTRKIDESRGDVTLCIKSEGGEKEVSVTPVLSEYDNIKRIGLWVRDSTAGVGTLTYTDPDTLTYGALGHGVSDVDTGVRFDVLTGSIEECGIGGIVKGEKGSPGELRGMFYPDAEVLGNITENSQEGIFGNVLSEPVGESVSLGHKSEIEKGAAILRTSLDGKSVKDYEIEITRVLPNSKNTTKGFVIEVTDEELIEKTGGIVQGMSGSPILQNGKLIGAVTHVLVNDPTRGYGIFIENMIAGAEKVK